MAERRIGFRGIIQTRTAGFVTEQFLSKQFPERYGISRGLVSQESPKELEVPNIPKEFMKFLEDEDYVTLLPNFEGKTVIEVIEDKIVEGDVVRILDVGCGKGNFLINCKERWGDCVECVGISAYPYHEVNTDELSELGIRIVQGDAQFLRRYFKRETFDVVTSVEMTSYLSDKLAFLKGVHAGLKNDGIALIDNLPIPTSERGDQDQLANYLQDAYGFEITRNLRGIYRFLATPGENVDGLKTWEVAFRKKTRRLYLPVSFDGEFLGQLFYRLNRNVSK